ncbi:NAD(P)-binding protein [Thozetella sp. PMI_491]|nr:NAD(P)-binding protein [Thozetella sp. PMI_491]
MSTSTPETILITGANGYLALHTIKQALARGWNIVGTVRSTSSAAAVRAIFPSMSESRLALVQVPDITQAALFQPAFTLATTPITAIINAASPITINPQDPRRDVLDPAINSGTAILDAAARYGGPTLRRVVHVSSFAAILDITRADDSPGVTYTSDDWSPLTYEMAATGGEMAAYAGSKALAERAMWEYVRENPVTFDFVSVASTAIFGPQVEGPNGEGRPDLKHLNMTSSMLWELVVPADVPPPWNSYHLGTWVDVRVVASALLASIAVPEAGGQRFLCGQRTHWQFIRDAIHRLPQTLGLHERVAVGEPGAGERAKETTYDADGTKVPTVLGVEYTALDQSLLDSYEQLLQAERSSKGALST